jgi:hypothetical protein
VGCCAGSDASAISSSTSSRFDFPLSSEAMDFATQWPGVIGSPAIAGLGIRLRDPRETYRDTIRWLHRAGHLTARQAGKLAD